MIHRAKFQNFKALKDVEITFDSRLTVLVGPNGSGKTSVLKAIRWLTELCVSNQQLKQNGEYLKENLASLHSGGSDRLLLEITSQTNGRDVGVRVIGHPTRPIRTAPEGAFSGTNGGPATFPLNGKPYFGLNIDVQPIPSQDDKDVLMHLLSLPFGHSELVRLQSSHMAAPSNTTSLPPRMNDFGEGLASQLAYFHSVDNDRFEQVIALFKRLISNVVGIRIGRADAGQPVLGEQLLFDLPGRKGVPASAMSDGTLYALGLIVKILDPQRPKTLLIDDIDHGFHPKAQLTLVELLHKLLDEIPDLQIIATAHSPYILSGLNWNEVRVTGLRDDGSAVIQPLTKHPNYEKWKESMSPGEFWSHAGEEWVLRVPAGEAIAR
ncbi:MAG: AAA family ATPase [Armatimonadaceae bacterium]